MAKVRIGTKIVRIGDDSYRPSVADIEEAAKSIGPMSKNDNSIYAKGGKWDLKKKFGRFGSGPKFMGLPMKEMALTSGIPPASVYEMITKEPSEDLLPAFGQTAGSMIAEAGTGGSLRAGGVGGVAGAVAGQAGRQGVKGLRGFKPQWGEVPKEAALTGAMELVTRTVPGLTFFKQYGGKSLKASGQRVQNIARDVQQKAPFIRFSKNDVIQRINQHLDEIPFERGPQRESLEIIRDNLAGMKKPLTFDEYWQLEQEIGRRAKYAKDVSKSGVFQKGPPGPRSDAALKLERTRVSGKLDEAATRAGHPEFAKESKNFSRLAKSYSEEELNKGTPLYRGLLGLGLAGGASVPTFYGDDANPALATAATLALLPQKTKTAIFRKVIDTPVMRNLGRTLSLGTAEIMRRINSADSDGS